MRQIARKVWLKELVDGDYEEKDGWEPNVLHTGRGDVSRCNVVGSLLSMNGRFSLDDGTAQVPLRAFDPVPGLDEEHVDSFVQAIVRPRKYQGSLFLVPEVICPVDPVWGQVRKLELGEVRHYEAPQEPSKASSQPVSANKAEHLLLLISRFDEGQGAQVQDVVDASKLGDAAEEILDQLILDGEIFEIKPGVVKVL